MTFSSNALARVHYLIPMYLFIIQKLDFTKRSSVKVIMFLNQGERIRLNRLIQLHKFRPETDLFTNRN